MTVGLWHGTKRCAVNRAKIPRGQQIVGAKCPFCGNTMGAEIGARKKAPSLEAQLAKLQQLHDDGVITDDELQERRAAAIDKDVAKPTPPKAAPVPASTLYPTPSPSLFETLKKNRVPAVGFAIGLIVLLAIAWVGDAGGDTASSSVATQSATREVEGTLLGDAWIGAGSYTLHAAAKAYNAAGDFTAYAARISAPGADDLYLYWYAGGRNFGDGLTLGDTVTREFSDWGSLASADSPGSLHGEGFRSDASRAGCDREGWVLSATGSSSSPIRLHRSSAFSRRTLIRAPVKVSAEISPLLGAPTTPAIRRR